MLWCLVFKRDVVTVVVRECLLSFYISFNTPVSLVHARGRGLDWPLSTEPICGLTELRDPMLGSMKRPKISIQLRT